MSLLSDNRASKTKIDVITDRCSQLTVLSFSTLLVILSFSGCSQEEEEKKGKGQDDKIVAAAAVPVAKTMPPSPKYLQFEENRKENYFNELAKRPDTSSPEKLAKQSNAKAKEITLPSGLRYIDIEEGWGGIPQRNGNTIIHYTGWLEDGSKFDSSLDKRIPFQFYFGKGEVIIGLEQGLSNMKVGGTRVLIIPPNLAYGSKGLDGKIPSNATITYKVRLLSAGKG